MHLIVADSSPVIYLTRLGFFSLLRILHDSVIVPASVWNEVVIGGAGLPESQALQTAVADGWIQVMAPTVNAPALGARAADWVPVRFMRFNSPVNCARCLRLTTRKAANWRNTSA